MKHYPLISQATNTFLTTDLGLLPHEKLLIIGPCAIESYEHFANEISFALSENVSYVRAGIFKPRTSPYDFQGLQKDGLAIIAKIKAEQNIKLVSEIMATEDLPLYEQYIDIIQVGARNMQNFALLKALGKSQKPILLKRGFGCTINEWLGAAEYILQAGNAKVILCERGIKTFETETRNTLDLSAIPVIKQYTQLPIIVDPSHAAGRSDIVPALAQAALAAGADGLLLEVHQNPKASLSDADQALSHSEFHELNEQLKKLVAILK